MAELRGYKPLGGTSRKYRTPGGKIISRREYDNRRAKAVGFKNRYELEKFRTQVVAKGKWSDWQYDVRQRTGRMPTYQDYADVRDVRARRAELKKLHPELRGRDIDMMDDSDGVLRAPDGPLARILDHSGRRPMSGYPVGDSPK